MTALDAVEKRLALWWLALTVLTLISLEGAGVLGRWSAAAVLVIAFMKVRIVIREFMDVRTAPLPLRLVLDSWGVTICGTLIYLIL